MVRSTRRSAAPCKPSSRGNSFGLPPEIAESLIHETFTTYYTEDDRPSDANAWLIGAACHSAKTYLQRRGWPSPRKATPVAIPYPGRGQREGSRSTSATRAATGDARANGSTPAGWQKTVRRFGNRNHVDRNRKTTRRMVTRDKSMTG